MLTFNVPHQAVLIKKINAYLKYINRDLELEGGYCHGLTLLWLYKMSEGKEQWFYETIEKIVLCNAGDYDTIEMDMEKFIAHIEWLQNPTTYVKGLQQLDIDFTVEVPVDFSLTYQFERRKMNEVLDKIIPENKMICMSTQEHSIGVFKRGEIYYLYDSNYPWNGALIIKDIRTLKSEIIDRMFILFGKPIDKMGLRINVFSNPLTQRPLKKQLIDKDQLIKETKNIHQLDTIGINTFYLSCESGDIEMVKKLIAVGADVNQLFKNNTSSGLAIAAIHNDEAIVKLLLNHAANPNIKNIGNCTALHFVADLGYANIAKIILQNGADPLSLNEKNVTPLSFALESEQWQTAALLLSYIGNIESIPRNDIRDLREHKKEMLSAICGLLPTLAEKKQRFFMKLVKDIYKRSWNTNDEKILIKNSLFKNTLQEKVSVLPDDLVDKNGERVKKIKF